MKEGTWAKGSQHHPVEKLLSVCMTDDSNDRGMQLPLSLLSPQSKTLVYHPSLCCSFLSLPPEGETHWDRWEMRSKTNQAITVIWMKDERRAVHIVTAVLWEESQFKSINDQCNNVFFKKLTAYLMRYSSQKSLDLNMILMFSSTS